MVYENVIDNVSTVTPDAMKVKAGTVTGELTDMKVTESVEFTVSIGGQ